MDILPRNPRTWVEWGLFAYLIEIAFARAMAPWLRDIPILVIVVALTWGLTRDRHAENPAPDFELKLPALLFLISFALPIALSENFWPSLYRAAYLPIAFLIFFAAQYALIDIRSFRRLSGVLAVVILLIGIDGTVQFATGESLLGGWSYYSNTTRIRAGLPHPNDLSILAILLPIALTSLVSGGSRIAQATTLASLPFVVMTAIASRSRNAWIGLVCAFGVMILLTRFRKLLVSAAIGIALVLAIAWTFEIGRFPARLSSLGNLGQEGRIGIWLSSVEMFKAHPWFGIGPNIFADFYLETLEQTPLPQGYNPELRYIPWAHNLYLEALAERGIVGLTGMLVILFAALGRVWRALRKAGEGPVRDYALAIAAAWAALLVMGLFDLTFLKDWVLLVFLLLAALSSRLKLLVVGEGPQSPGSTPTQPQTGSPLKEPTQRA